jgi:cyclin-dependent kinase 12/13
VQVRFYVHQFLLGLVHCHDRGVLHCEIKGTNLLLDNNVVLKISSFDLASFFDSNHKQLMKSIVVTLWYQSPKLLLGATNYGVGLDLWSVDVYLLSCWLEGCSWVRSGRCEPVLYRLLQED